MYLALAGACTEYTTERKKEETGLRNYKPGGGEVEMAKKEFMTVVDEIAFKYANLVNERIDKVENGLTGEDLREVYDGIQMLGHITATMERLSRMGDSKTA